jgi:hypothetical protein
VRRRWKIGPPVGDLPHSAMRGPIRERRDDHVDPTRVAPHERHHRPIAADEAIRAGARCGGGSRGAGCAALDAHWHNAAASNAVTARINAKDALCFAMAGHSTAADDHRSAVNELRALGSAGRQPATALDRLLGLKDRAQYEQRGVSAMDAQAAVRRASTLVDTAERIVWP